MNEIKNIEGMLSVANSNGGFKTLQDAATAFVEVKRLGTLIDNLRNKVGELEKQVELNSEKNDTKPKRPSSKGR